MLITSPSGERYALGFHGEGLLLVTRDGARYTTDGRYIEAAREQIVDVYKRQVLEPASRETALISTVPS